MTTGFDIGGHWAKLMPHITVYGPDDDVARPAVLLFHGSGGIRSHLHDYAKAAAEAGWRAFVVDSYGHRGWKRWFSFIFVSTLILFHGHERTVDVRAALWGVKQRPDVDTNTIVLAGWSHGSWTIMDLMTLEPETSDLLHGVAGLFLVYPYIGPKSRTPTHGWRWWPKTMLIVSGQDHITAKDFTHSVFGDLKAQGLPLETRNFDATHAYDEPGFAIDWPPNQPMRHHAQATKDTIAAFVDFLKGI
ncbi:dienelactone hydrolase family protein [Asticcacaulis sp. SL142]|uniref:dienelactone hydrolase family protein n=1 Tax=Asticcacaulis sp. SL142 TaxID=2995155 RepID=UPI00226CC75D|nr:dienelactone hydrolase family protein [Asticcacaulis sp. SL142]WAC47355.1 dienelactone hydrolase family protein [Asticcacaulis sp. SL142]